MAKMDRVAVSRLTPVTSSVVDERDPNISRQPGRNTRWGREEDTQNDEMDGHSNLQERHHHPRSPTEDKQERKLYYITSQEKGQRQENGIRERNKKIPSVTMINQQMAKYIRTNGNRNNTEKKRKEKTTKEETAVSNKKGMEYMTVLEKEEKK